MNIFKILSDYSGKITETNISSFLSYLLNANESHGLKQLFLREIISNTNPSDEIQNMLKSKIHRTEILPEFPVDVESTQSPKNNRRIDILVEIYFSSDKTKPEIALCIENKILTSSIQDKEQIIDEYQGLRKYYDSEESKDTLIHTVVIAPENDKIESLLDFESSKGDSRDSIFWINNTTKPSIVSILTDLLTKEKVGIIDPINSEFHFLLKCFLAFIRSDFNKEQETTETRTRKNYLKPIKEYLKEIVLKNNVDECIKVEELKEKLTEAVLKFSGEEIDVSTRYCQIKKAIVNEPTRTNWYVTQPDNASNNLFYYPDEEDKTVIKKFSLEQAPDTIKIYWQNDETKESISVKELRELRNKND